MGVGFIRVGSYHQGKYHGSVKDSGKLSAHLKYIGFRSREIAEDDRGFFNDKTNAADWRKFQKEIETHKALQHSSTVKAHKIIFSLREKDYKAYVASGRDYKDIVRKVLNDYEKRKGVSLEWIAVKHDQNEHPHCHVVIRAVSQTRKSASKRIFFSKEDIADLKRSFDLEVDRNRNHEYELKKENELARDLDLNDIFKGINKGLEKHIREQERLAEMEKNKIDRNKGR